MVNKGGLVGLTYNDFNYRQKSGVWSINEHAEDINYIRTGEVPNNYLLVGTYSDLSLHLYDLYYKTKISTNIFNVDGAVTCIDYNYNKSLIAFGLTSPPYLQVFSTEDFTEKDLGFSLTDSLSGFSLTDLTSGSGTDPAVMCLRFNNAGDRLFVGLLTSVNDSYVITYETDNFTLVEDLAAINFLPTSIRVSLNDQIISISHFGDVDNPYSNIHVFNNYTDETLYSLTSLQLNTVLDTCFLDNTNLLAIASTNSPYLIFYNYVTKNTYDKYNSEISNNITSRVTSLVKTSDNKILLIGLDSSPYLVKLTFSTGKISLIGLNAFSDSIVSMSLSINDEILSVSQRGSNTLQLFDFSNQDLTIPISLDILPSSTVLSSSFLLGPVLEYIDILKPECSISSDDLGLVAINSDSELVYTGTFYDESLSTQTPDLAAHKQIFQSSLYKSLDYNSSYITSIKIDGSLVSNDINILQLIDQLNNIIQVSSYYSRIALLDSYNSVLILPSNHFSLLERQVIEEDLSSKIKQISVGYQTLLALTTANTVISTNISFFNASSYPLPNITQVSAGYSHIALLTEHNTVLTFGSNSYGQCLTSEWDDVKQVSVGDYHTAALTNSNTILVTGPFISQVKSTIESLTDILYIASSPLSLIVVHSDFTISQYGHNLSTISSTIDTSSLTNIGNFIL